MKTFQVYKQTIQGYPVEALVLSDGTIDESVTHERDDKSVEITIGFVVVECEDDFQSREVLYPLNGKTEEEVLKDIKSDYYGWGNYDW